MTERPSFAAPPTTHATERVAAVVLNWNGWRDTIGCIESLKASADVPAVFVVDNGSDDDSVDRIMGAARWVRIVRLESNLGFSGGMNAGISAAIDEIPSVDYIWILNNDTIVEPTTLSEMVEMADADPNIGIVGSKLVLADGSGRIQALGGGAINRWLGTTSTYVTPQSKPYDHLVGASLLARQSLLRQIGGFDERYFFYLEDTDLTLRARRAGWRLAVAADAVVIHRRGASIDGGLTIRSFESDVMNARSSAIFISSLALPWRITATPLRLAGMLGRRIIRGQFHRVRPLTQAYLDGLRLGRRPPQIPQFGQLRAEVDDTSRGWRADALGNGPAPGAARE